jgi:hypothetical protein
MQAKNTYTRGIALEHLVVRLSDWLDVKPKQWRLWSQKRAGMKLILSWKERGYSFPVGRFSVRTPNNSKLVTYQKGWGGSHPTVTGRGLSHNRARA